MKLEPIMKLEWKYTEEIYINITSLPGKHLLLSGDNQGCIWLYYLGERFHELQIAAKQQIEEIKMRGVERVLPSSLASLRVDALVRPFRVCTRLGLCLALHCTHYAFSFSQPLFQFFLAEASRLITRLLCPLCFSYKS